MPSFKIGINMAGAVSAGAYTAGVLDFLVEALDAWHASVDQGAAVPRHEVSIEIFTGASAGGMCAAISSVLLREDFEHIRDVTKSGTNNRLYESWVNRIDIRQMLTTSDLTKNAPVVSLLNSSIIDEIATYALTPGGVAKSRRYVSPGLTLFLSLTNLRGVNYSLNGAAAGSVEETTFFYGDRVRFPGNGTADFSQLKSAAMATGAFPIFLAPRVLNRSTEEYAPPVWEPVTSALADPKPNFRGLPDKQYRTLNVDGGVTNNDPFNYAHDYLNGLAPAPLDDGANPETVDRAAIDIAPFPTTDAFEANYKPEDHSGIFPVLTKLVGALISQSRFYGESLNAIMHGQVFNRYVIAPSGDAVALQCGSLGAFGGFFSRGFRAHDYVLGRRNCQEFLRMSFVLPKSNPVIAAGLAALDPAARAAVEQTYSVSDPRKYGDPKGMGPKDWMPIVPLCTPTVSAKIDAPARAKITSKELDEIVALLLKRFQAVVGQLASTVDNALLRCFLKPGPFVIALLSRDTVKKALIGAFGADYDAG